MTLPFVHASTEVVAYVHAVLTPGVPVIVVDPMLNILMTGELVADGAPLKLSWNESVWPDLMSVEEALLDDVVAFDSVTAAADTVRGITANEHRSEAKRITAIARC